MDSPESTTSVSSPSRAVKVAAGSPATPPPTTITSLESAASELKRRPRFRRLSCGSGASCRESGSEFKNYCHRRQVFRDGGGPRSLRANGLMVRECFADRMSGAVFVASAFTYGQLFLGFPKFNFSFGKL
jgi:hypothetical protein